MKILYTAHATAVEGRSGHVQTDDNNISVELGSPGGTSKKTGKVTNPEQLFACGYAACFGSALEAAAKLENTAVRNVEVHSDVSLNQGDDNGYFLSVTLNVAIPGVENAVADKIVRRAHGICPYSKALHGNVEVTLKVNGQAVSQAA